MDKPIGFLIVLQVAVVAIPVVCWILAGVKWHKVKPNGKGVFWKVCGIAAPLMITSILLIENLAPVKNGVPSKMVLLSYPIFLLWGITGLVLLIRANKKLKQ